MPEIRECIAHFVLLLHMLGFFNWCALRPWPLLEIWVDATKNEMQHSQPHREKARIAAGLPYPLSETSQAHRGPRPTRLWPDGVTGGPFGLKRRMRLRDVVYSARALYLDFGHRWLSFQFLTHSSVHMYTLADWELLKNIPQEGRSYKFALVLVFSQAVIAFQTLDMMFQPTWHKSCPSPQPNVCPWTEETPYPENVSFLQTVADFLRKRWARGTRAWPNQLAIQYVRTLGDIFPGIGVYSVSEIFTMAGLPHDLTVAELFNCPSRLARFCEAYYSFTWRAWAEGWKSFIRRAMHGYLLAPTTQHRLLCASGYFITWAKERIRVSMRMEQLYEAAKENSWFGLPHEYDVFEPSFLEPAFKREVHLGPLIFGRKWWNDNYGDKFGMPADDPLTLAFLKCPKGIKDKELYLNLEEYYQPGPPLILSSERLGYSDIVETFTYKVKKQIVWSLTAPRHGVSHTIVAGEDRAMRVAKTIISSTEKVSVGPLEYCGMALAFRKRGKGKKYQIGLCKGDPSLTVGKIDYVAVHLRSLARAKEKLSTTATIDGKSRKKGAAALRQKLRKHQSVKERIAVHMAENCRLSRHIKITRVSNGWCSRSERAKG
ncbi:hypothetical protein EXIGLDRAFT_766221 [Exidia glandulosa HHB12029]|uniref:Uncharacterized protein n=1 Tax=Exidia glandulosa HHB12029 TaxID=1314781 RepID=A0A165JW18_EXIGL|nr:hypothetical protein EXIGLDRAFT_766221 [Exidia glandulosa HHB12029]